MVFSALRITYEQIPFFDMYEILNYENDTILFTFQKKKDISLRQAVKVVQLLSLSPHRV